MLTELLTWILLAGIQWAQSLIKSSLIIEPNYSNVYISGSFTINDTVATKIARWDGTSWYELGPGISSGSIKHLASYHNKLYATGEFTIEDSSLISDAAVWDGEHWSSLILPTAIVVNDLFVHDSSLYIVTTTSNSYNLLEYNGSSFDLITSLTGISSLDYRTAFFLHDTLCFSFYEAIYFFDGAEWHPKCILPEPLKILGEVVVNNSIYTVIDSSNNKIKTFRRIQGSLLSSSLGKFRLYDSINNIQFSLGYDELGGAAYVGGNFSFVDNTQCAAFGKFDGLDWSNVGWFGATPSYASQSPCVYSSHFDSLGNNLYVTGRFTWVEDSMAYGVARWGR
jgi:hypothetical protein